MCWIGPSRAQEPQYADALRVFVPYVGKTRSRKSVMHAPNYHFDKLLSLDLSSGLTPDLRIGGFWSADIQDAYPNFEEQTFSFDASMAATQSLSSFVGLDLHRLRSTRR